MRFIKFQNILRYKSANFTYCESLVNLQYIKTVDTSHLLTISHLLKLNQN